jgi:hypothetical protein
MSKEYSTIKVSTHIKINFQLVLPYQTSVTENAGWQVIKFSIRDDPMGTYVSQNKYYTSTSGYKVQPMGWKHVCHKTNANEPSYDDISLCET